MWQCLRPRFWRCFEPGIACFAGCGSHGPCASTRSVSFCRRTAAWILSILHPRIWGQWCSARLIPLASLSQAGLFVCFFVFFLQPPDGCKGKEWVCWLFLVCHTQWASVLFFHRRFRLCMSHPPAITRNGSYAGTSWGESIGRRSVKTSATSSRTSLFMKVGPEDAVCFMPRQHELLNCLVLNPDILEDEAQ